MNKLFGLGDRLGQTYQIHFRSSFRQQKYTLKFLSQFECFKPTSGCGRKNNCRGKTRRTKTAAEEEHAALKERSERGPKLCSHRPPEPCRNTRLCLPSSRLCIYTGLHPPAGLCLWSESTGRLQHTAQHNITQSTQDTVRSARGQVSFLTFHKVNQ